MSTSHAVQPRNEFRSAREWATFPNNFRLSGPLWLTLGGIGLVAFFWSGLASLLHAWARPEYSHGYFIPVVALYLFLTLLLEEKAHPDAASGNRWFGVALVLLGLVFGLCGNLVHIPDITTYGFLLCIAGFMFTVVGARRGLFFLIPVVYLGFMLPLPNFIYWPLSIKLQMISSEIGVFFIKLFGVPVYLDGNVIDLGIYKLQVAEACNGLRYLFPLMSFGFLFAVFYKGPLWHKVLLFLSTVPITVLMNCVRIGAIGLLVDRYGIEQAEGFLHFFEGWIIFMACIVVLYGLAVALQRLTRRPMPVHQMLEMDLGAVARQLGRARDIKATGALIFVSAMTLGLGIAWHLLPQRAAAAVSRDPLVLFPQEMGGWRGTPQLLERDIERVLG